MKRTIQSNQENAKGVVISLSDVIEVTFKENTAYHRKGDKKLVSIPIAHKLYKQGKVTMSKSAEEEIKKLEEAVK